MNFKEILQGVFPFYKNKTLNLATLAYWVTHITFVFVAFTFMRDETPGAGMAPDTDSVPAMLAMAAIAAIATAAMFYFVCRKIAGDRMKLRFLIQGVLICLLLVPVILVLSMMVSIYFGVVAWVFCYLLILMRLQQALFIDKLQKKQRRLHS